MNTARPPTFTPLALNSRISGCSSAAFSGEYAKRTASDPAGGFGLVVPPPPEDEPLPPPPRETIAAITTPATARAITMIRPLMARAYALVRKSAPSCHRRREPLSRDAWEHALGGEARRQVGARQHHHRLLRIAQPRRVGNGEAVGGERHARGLDLLDAPVPQVAALVEHVVVVQLIYAALDAERMALGGHAPALEGGEHAVGGRLEHRGLAERALAHAAAEGAALRGCVDAQIGQLVVQPGGGVAVGQRRHAALGQLAI